MESIGHWLERLGLGRYSAVFAEADIDFAVLPDLSETDFEKLGVTLGHRKKLLRAIADLGAPGAGARSDGSVANGPPVASAAERRQVTVLFCDLVGSTGLASRLDAEDLREVIGRYHACVAETVRRFEGFVAKYMGDGVLVYFGYPHAHEDDAEQAVRAGLALVEAVNALTPPSAGNSAGFAGGNFARSALSHRERGNTSSPLPPGEGQGEGRLQVRVGIASGLVVVGDLIGQGSAQEQAIVGETPNLAARLQVLAEPNAIVIAEGTRRQIGAMFEVADLGPQPLKGFSQPQPAWRVLAENRALGRFEALRSGATPLVGRDEELDLLLRRWAQAKAGSGRVALISAEPGIGKSRLAEAVAERIAGEPHVRLRYFCSPHHQDSALYPVIAQMERAAGFCREDSSDTKLAKLQVLLTPSFDAGHCEERSDEAIQNAVRRHNWIASPSARNDSRVDRDSNPAPEDIAVLAELHSLPSADLAPPLDVSPQRKRERTFEALLRRIERLSSRQPVLMVFEDIHWIDPSSRELLDRTMERIATWPVLLVATFRPEFQPPWTGQPHVTTLALTRLDRHDTAAMVATIAGKAGLPSDIVAEIAERTDGVPLFVEELTKAVLESGVQAATLVTTVQHAALSVPATLHASLMARLDRLGAVAKDVAQKGAVIGREFGYELLASVADLPEPQLWEALHRLTDSGLLFPRGTPPQSTYIFKHALVQDAAYGTLLRSRRHQLHARIVAALEDRFPEIVTARPELLARHCAEAGLADKAVVYRLKAGQQSLARSAMTEAVAQLRKGLDVLAGLPDGPWRREQELDLQVALRTALSATKGYAAAEVGETLARARALADQTSRPEYLVPLSLGQWLFHVIRSEHKLALSLAEQIEKIGEARNDVGVQLHGHRAHGNTRFFLGEFVASRNLLEQCHGLSDPAHRASAAGGLPYEPFAGMLAHLAGTLAYLGYIDQARSRLDEAFSDARRLSHAFTRASVLIYANMIDSLACSPELPSHAQELLDLSNAHGFQFHLALALAYRGRSLTVLGQAQEGVALLAQGLVALRATGTVIHTPVLLVWLAEAYAMLGQPVEGLNCLAEAAQIIEATEERVGEAELHRVRGDLLNAIGDRSAAERNYRQALAVAGRQSAKLLELRAAMSLARLWCGQGKRAEARDLLVPIYA